MPGGGNLLLTAMALALLVRELKADCSLKGCSSCQFALRDGFYYQICVSCNTGFQLNTSSGECNFNVGLVIGVSVGAVLIVVFQISLFCLCQVYFKKKYRKRSQFTLDEIFSQLQEQRNDPDVRKELQKKYGMFLDKNKLCKYCEANHQDKLQFHEYEKNLNAYRERKAERERKQNDPASNQIIENGQEEEEQEQQPADPTIPTLYTACKCFYHLPCLKKQLKNNPTTECICKKTTLTPFKMICVQCRMKERVLNFDLSVPQNLQSVQDYVCAICFKKKLDKQKKKSIWKKFL